MKNVNDSLKILIENLQEIRSELDGKVNNDVLDRFDQIVIELKSTDFGRDGPEKALMLLGLALEYVPSIIKAVDALMNR